MYYLLRYSDSESTIVHNLFFLINIISSMYSFLCVRIHNFSMYTKSQSMLDGELNIVYLQAHPKSRPRET